MEYTNIYINIIMILLAILPAAWAFINIVKSLTQGYKSLPQNFPRNYKVPSFKLLSLQRPERKNKTWLLLNILLIISSTILLLADCYLIYLLIKNWSAENLAIGSIIFLLVMIALPLWSLIDILIIEPRVRKKGRSSVAESATVELEGDIGILFEQCQKVLVDMGASITKLDFESKVIEADLGRQVMTIKIEQTEQSRNKVSILSDSKLLSVKFDFGRNRRNIDTFIKRLLYREDG